MRASGTGAREDRARCADQPRRRAVHADSPGVLRGGHPQARRRPGHRAPQGGAPERARCGADRRRPDPRRHRPLPAAQHLLPGRPGAAVRRSGRLRPAPERGPAARPADRRVRVENPFADLCSLALARGPCRPWARAEGAELRELVPPLAQRRAGPTLSPKRAGSVEPPMARVALPPALARRASSGRKPSPKRPSRGIATPG